MLLKTPLQRGHFQPQKRRQCLHAKAFLADDAPKFVLAEKICAHIDNTVEGARSFTGSGKIFLAERHLRKLSVAAGFVRLQSKTSSVALRRAATNERGLAGTFRPLDAGSFCRSATKPTFQANHDCTGEFLGKAPAEREAARWTLPGPMFVREIHVALPVVEREVVFAATHMIADVTRLHR